MTEYEKAVRIVAVQQEYQWPPYQKGIEGLQNQAEDMGEFLEECINSLDSFSYYESAVNDLIGDSCLYMVCLSVLAHQNVLSYHEEM